MPLRGALFAAVDEMDAAELRDEVVELRGEVARLTAALAAAAAAPPASPPAYCYAEHGMLHPTLDTGQESMGEVEKRSPPAVALPVPPADGDERQDGGEMREDLLQTPHGRRTGRDRPARGARDGCHSPRHWATASNASSRKSRFSHAASHVASVVLTAHAPKYTMESYLATKWYVLWLQRIPWLLALLVLQSASAFIMQTFQYLLQQHIVVAFFLTMIVGAGGNAGNQPCVMVTRALAGDGAAGTDGAIARLFRKEMVVAVAVSVTMFCAGWLRVLIQFPEEHTAALAISASLAAVVVVSTVLGFFFSVLMERVGIDPAHGAAPLLTTLSDIIGISILCSMCAVVLHAPPGVQPAAG